MLGASGAAIYSGLVATVALILAVITLGWNVRNAYLERTARRLPDVHGVLVVDVSSNRSKVVFANAGSGIARAIEFLLVENGAVYQGGVHTPFLANEERVEMTVLPFASTAGRSNLVWAYMDSDHNVHARGNSGQRYVYEHPARVEIGEVFQRFYPKVPLPSRSPLPYLGEL